MTELSSQVPFNSVDMHVLISGISTQMSSGVAGTSISTDGGISDVVWSVEARLRGVKYNFGEQDANRPSCRKMREILQMTHEHASTVEPGKAPVLLRQHLYIKQQSLLRRQAHEEPR